MKARIFGVVLDAKTTEALREVARRGPVLSANGADLRDRVGRECVRQILARLEAETADRVPIRARHG